MKKVILELDVPEAMKLVSVCNSVISAEEEALNYQCSYKVREMTKNSIEVIKMLKAKIKTAIAERKESK